MRELQPEREGVDDEGRALRAPRRRAAELALALDGQRRAEAQQGEDGRRCGAPLEAKGHAGIGRQREGGVRLGERGAQVGEAALLLGRDGLA